MKGVGIAVTTALAGALTTYLLDPQMGRRRRAVTRDRIYSWLNRLDDAARVAAVDLRNRTTGTLVALRSRATGDDEVGDEVLAERVRATLGRVVSHPRSIEVSAAAGVVTLHGHRLQAGGRRRQETGRLRRPANQASSRLNNDCAGVRPVQRRNARVAGSNQPTGRSTVPRATAQPIRASDSQNSFARAT